MTFLAGKTYVAIDGTNLAYTLRGLGLDLDYKRLRDHIAEDCDLIRIGYYTAIPEDQEFVRIRPLVDFLAYNGYDVVSKPTKNQTGSDGVRRLKGNMDVEIVVDAMEMAPYYDNLVLFSGDGDFTALVKGLQRKGKRVTVVSTVKGSSQVLADELRRAADRFVDLEDLKDLVARPPSDARSRVA